MIIENIDQTKAGCIKDLKYNGKRFLNYFLVNNLIGIAFGFVFLYIEHCYDVVEEPKSYRETGFVKICTERRRLLNETTKNATGSILSTDRIIGDFHTRLEQICENDTTVDELIVCEVNKMTLTKWGEYVMSIQYTIGWGNVVTRSQLGRWVTIISMIPLIVLNAVCYIYCGATVINIVKLLVVFIEERILKRSIIVWFNRKLLASQFVLMISAVSCYAVFAKNTFFQKLSTSDALYASIVTFTTVGFGDVVYTREDFAENFTITFLANQIFFLVTFAMVASCITAITEMVSNESNGQKGNDVQPSSVGEKTSENIIINNLTA